MSLGGMGLGGLAGATNPRNRDARFLFRMALAMAVVVVAGFTMQLAMGRSSFAAPLRVHLHAVTFGGWVVIFVAQAWLAAQRQLAQHRLLGRLAALWLPLMLATGFTVTLALVREGRAPFFFAPQQFLIADPVTLLTFTGLTLAALRLRRASDWHMRLQVCAFAALMGPGFGRLLPMPLLIPYGFEIAALAALVFPLYGMVHDRRATGRVHSAWLWGSAAIVGMVLLFNLIAYSPLGDRIYAAATQGSPGAALPGLALPPPPGAPPA